MYVAAGAEIPMPVARATYAFIFILSWLLLLMGV
jgi:hypothetical protein